MFQRLSTLFARLINTLSKRPATSFCILLGLLFGIIALGHFLRSPLDLPPLNQDKPKKTAVFDLAHDTASTLVPVKVTKGNVVHITALARGIVTDIFTAPGRSVRAGQTLIALTDDYQSGRTELNRKAAQESADLTEELAKIDKRIAALDIKRIKHDDTLNDTQEKIALEQVKKNKAARKSALEQSALSLALGTRSDAVLKPRTFISGTVQSIPVHKGDLVAAGDIIATLATPHETSTLEAFLDARTATLFDPTAEATLTLGNETLALQPTFFSRTENEQGLFSVLFTLSEATKQRLIDGEYLTLALPLKSDEDHSFLVPVDAVYQNDSETTVLIERDGQAITAVITLGELQGAFATVRAGLSPNDRIILNRSVIAHDPVVIVP